MASNSLVPELYCSDLQKTLAVYTEILGFKILYQREEEKFACLERQGAQIMFEEIGIGRNWLSAKLERPFGRGINFQIQTDSIDDLCRIIENSNLLLFLPMEEKWYRKENIFVGNKQFIVQDPDGYLLRFYEDLGTKSAD